MRRLTHSIFAAPSWSSDSGGVGPSGRATDIRHLPDASHHPRAYTGQDGLPPTAGRPDPSGIEVRSMTLRRAGVAIGTALAVSSRAAGRKAGARLARIRPLRLPPVNWSSKARCTRVRRATGI